MSIQPVVETVRHFDVLVPTGVYRHTWGMPSHEEWYFDGPPETTEQAARSFAAVPNRLMFVGHYHRWLLATLKGIQPWVGDRPTSWPPRSLPRGVHAVCAGKCALHDTDTDELIPFAIETSHSVSPP